MMIDKYLKWIKDNTVETKQDNGWTEVATPFMDRHNDGLIIYVKEDADMEYTSLTTRNCR